jgi:hypothetical protein
MEQTLAVREPQDMSEAEVEYINVQAMQKKIDVELPAIIKVAEERIEQRRLAQVAQSDATKSGIKENYDEAEKEKKKSEKHFADAAILEREVLTLQAELLTQKDELYDMNEALMETHNLRKRGTVEILRLVAAAADASSRLEFTLARSFSDQKKLYVSLSNRLEQTSIDIQVRLQKAEKLRLQKAEEVRLQEAAEKAEEVRLQEAAEKAEKVRLQKAEEEEDRLRNIENADKKKTRDAFYLKIFYSFCLGCMFTCFSRAYFFKFIFIFNLFVLFVLFMVLWLLGNKMISNEMKRSGMYHTKCRCRDGYFICKLILI